MNSLWEQFSGKPNSDAILGEKAVALSVVIARLASSAAEGIAKKVSELEDHHVSEVQQKDLWAEISIFFCHDTDRQVFSLIDQENRAVFMGELSSNVTHIIANSCETRELRDRFVTRFIERYDQRQIEYAQYSIFSQSDDKSLKGTLTWEFNSKIAELLGYKKHFDVVMISNAFIHSCLLRLDIGGLLLTE